MATITSNLIIANGVDVGEEINAKIPVSGSRGKLAGYESGTSQSGALTVTVRSVFIWMDTVFLLDLITVTST